MLLQERNFLTQSRKRILLESKEHMEPEKVGYYHNRTVQRLVELINKQNSEGTATRSSWMTKKLIEDNKKMVELLKSMPMKIHSNAEILN